MLDPLIKHFLNRELIRQLAVFGVVGVTATLTHYFVALFSHEIGRVDLYIANLFGYVSAVMVSYFGHSLFTFRQSLKLNIFFRFAITSVTTFLVSELILLFLESGLKLPHRVSLGVVVCTIPVITFIISKFWVFRPPAQNTSP